MSTTESTPHGHGLMGPSPSDLRWNDKIQRLERRQAACDAAQPCRNRGGALPCPCDGDETVEIGDVFEQAVRPGIAWEVTESLNVDLYRVRTGDEAQTVRGRWLRDPAQWTRARMP